MDPTPTLLCSKSTTMAGVIHCLHCRTVPLLSSTIITNNIICDNPVPEIWDTSFVPSQQPRLVSSTAAIVVQYHPCPPPTIIHHGNLASSCQMRFPGSWKPFPG